MARDGLESTAVLKAAAKTYKLKHGLHVALLQSKYGLGKTEAEIVAYSEGPDVLDKRLK